MRIVTLPFVSVIIPVLNGELTMRESRAAGEAADLSARRKLCIFRVDRGP